MSQTYTQSEEDAFAAGYAKAMALRMFPKQSDFEQLHQRCDRQAGTIQEQERLILWLQYRRERYETSLLELWQRYEKLLAIAQMDAGIEQRKKLIQSAIAAEQERK
jgi:hypothetical protein